MDLEQTQSPCLKIQGITKHFGSFAALTDVCFSAKRSEFVCVLGPSGCGKTTLLRIVAGLERQTQGSVHMGEQDVSGLPISRRNIGIAFQSYALFPNLTAAQNVAYGLKNQHTEKQQIRRRVEELLELVGLNGMGGKYPAQLSGGQQQRVALARAMALSPDSQKFWGRNFEILGTSYIPPVKPILFVHDYEGFSATELSKKLGVSQPTVSIGVKRGEKIAQTERLELEED